jgi:hypothetical protein
VLEVPRQEVAEVERLHRPTHAAGRGLDRRLGRDDVLVGCRTTRELGENLRPALASGLDEQAVLSVEEQLHGRPVDLSEKRAQTERKAIDSSNRASAIIFASSVNNKWGDYDPGALLEDEDKDQPPDPQP